MRSSSLSRGMQASSLKKIKVCVIHLPKLSSLPSIERVNAGFDQLCANQTSYTSVHPCYFAHGFFYSHPSCTFALLSVSRKKTILDCAAA